MPKQPTELDDVGFRDTDATLAEVSERCDRLKAERDSLAADLEHQKKLVETLAERVAAQSELLSKRAEAAPVTCAHDSQLARESATSDSPLRATH